MVRSILVMALVAASAGLSAQGRNRDRDAQLDDFGRPADAWCGEADRSNRNDYHSCDVREENLGGATSLDIDTGGNGGIKVRGVPGAAPHLRYRLIAHARSDADAQGLVKDIDVSIAGGRLRVRGPRTSGGEGWSVDVELETPPDLPLTLSSANGGISIRATSGRTRFETVNGGVSLADVSGDVRGRTVNGGVDVRLDGQRWDGAGLDVETTNGGVRMSVPDGYSADLTAETTNGGLNVDFPITVQGGIENLNRRVSTRLGSGGPRLHVRTVNGGVNIARR